MKKKSRRAGARAAVTVRDLLSAIQLNAWDGGGRRAVFLKSKLEKLLSEREIKPRNELGIPQSKYARHKKKEKTHA